MSAADKTINLALAGHPNVGKTTLFNALTGKNHKVGNFSGVTVSRTSGTFRTPHGHPVEIIDLPGAYSLVPSSPDEEVTSRTLLGSQEGESLPDLIVCVLDATALERQVAFLQQIIELELPTVVLLNKIEAAEAQGLRIDPEALSDGFQLPFIPVSAETGRGLTELRQAIRFPLPDPSEPTWLANSEAKAALATETALQEKSGAARPQASAILALSAEKNGTVPETASQLQAARQHYASPILETAVRRPDEATLALTDKIDAVALHPVWGWVIFSSIIALVFWTIFSFAGIPMDWIDAGTGALAEFVGKSLPEGDFNDLLTNGIIAGVGSVVIFLPQIVLLFFFISLLEGSGYLARAAFLMDRPMSKAGLSGKSFLPLLSGYACAIPAVMATRTIPNAKERLAAILVLPWTSCSARLPVYLILIPFLVTGAAAQTAVMFGIYALGTMTALVVARVLKPRLGNVGPSAFILELPPYKAPSLRYTLRQVGERAWSFLKKAGTLILGISIVLWFLNTYPKPDAETEAERQANSFIGRAGQLIEPVVRPLGWDAKIGTAMLTSFAAREVFVSSLAISYQVDEDEDGQALRNRLQAAQHPDGTPVLTIATVLSLLVFYIYALQCLPTTAVVRREAGSWKWALGQFLGMSAFAYGAALVTFQLANLFL